MRLIEKIHKAREIGNAAKNFTSVGWQAMNVYLKNVIHDLPHGHTFENNENEVLLCAASILAGTTFVLKGDEKEIEKGSKLDKLTKAMRFLMATNDLCDIAIPLNAVNTQASFYPRIELQNALKQRVHHYKSEYLSDYKKDEKLVENYIKDLILLAKNRDVVKDDNKSYIDLDTAIFEAFCIEIIYPKMLSKVGFNYSQTTNNYEDLKNKYKIFYDVSLVEKEEKEEHKSMIKRIQALHGIDMLLKIIDDIGYKKEHRDADLILNPPSFKKYLNPQSRYDRNLNDLRSDYFKMVANAGVPKLVSKTAELLFRLMPYVHRLKPQSKDPLFLELNKIRNIFGSRNFLIYIREELMSNTILPELFRDKFNF